MAQGHKTHQIVEPESNPACDQLLIPVAFSLNNIKAKMKVMTP